MSERESARGRQGTIRAMRKQETAVKRWAKSRESESKRTIQYNKSR